MNIFITVAVISFNSSKTIIETLDSILDQDFSLENVELIIADDCSADGTLDIVTGWSEKYEHFFGKLLIIENEKNQGVSKNFNRAAREANGVWFKAIAADDVLNKNCLLNNLDFSKKNPNAKVIFSEMYKFSKSISFSKRLVIDSDFFSRDAETQNKILRNGCNIYAPTAFIKTESLKQIGYADERYPMIEDYPLWYRFTKEGVKLYGFNEPTVYYRAGDSLSQQNLKIGNKNYFLSLYKFQRECIWPDLSWHQFLKKLDDFVLFKERMIGISFFRNRKSNSYKIFRSFIFVFRPYRIFLFLYKSVNNLK